ncbi:hypothetical protein IWW36_003713 [Coemansia brasiliensis]|uniref:Uncharacterized protein n=1 Tax=Coemansia brasiliensis TaxID=2650707 RepID=A0A9W8LWY6_9FUNG|nr:hypothetical protein IWW36_003713 [Coemansia brasiliensis]
MSSRVRTAFRPLEKNVSQESTGIRRAATSVPSLSYVGGTDYAQERLELLSRLEQRWCSSKPFDCCPGSSCVAPVPRRTYSSSSNSRPSSSGSLVEDDLACMELRGILGNIEGVASPGSRSSSASSASTGPFLAMDQEMDLFPLEEIVVPGPSPITRSGNPMPLDAGFGAAF